MQKYTLVEKEKTPQHIVGTFTAGRSIFLSFIAAVIGSPFRRNLRGADGVFHLGRCEGVMSCLAALRIDLRAPESI